MEQLFVLVTTYTPDPAKPPIVHVYGPYSQGQVYYRKSWYDGEIAKGNMPKELTVMAKRVKDPENESVFVWARVQS